MAHEGKAEGGYNASQKVYYCFDCGSIGQGNKMVSQHVEGCKGMGRRTKVSTELLKHREDEAKVNTQLWKQEQVEIALNAEYKEAKQRILDSIEEMRNIFGYEYQVSLEAYYKQIF